MLKGLRVAAVAVLAGVKNLWAGAKLAFFLPCRAQDFTVSVFHLWFVCFLGIATSIVLDYYSYTPPLKFNAAGLTSECFDFTLFLLSGYLLSLVFAQRELTPSFPVLCLNALILPFTCHTLLFIFASEWLKGKAYWDLRILFGTWYFLIFFRLLLLSTGTAAKRQALCALALVALLLLPESYIYFEPFWYTDYTESREESRTPRLYPEDVLQVQDLLLDKALAAVAPRARDKRTIYVVIFGAYADQSVFLKESLFVQKLLEEKYHTGGHMITLVNNASTLKTYPMATIANLKRTLAALGRQADPKKDMLLLYVTSHGSDEGWVQVEMKDIWLRQLKNHELKTMLDTSGFTWKAVIISACYSGSFIDALKDDKTLVITSARKDRTSFGCGDEFDMTYFGDAYFRQGLSKTDQFIPAFDIARKYVEKREEEEHIDPPSEPQIYVGGDMRKYLGK